MNRKNTYLKLNEGLNELKGKTILKFRRQKDCISIINTALQLCPNLMIIEIYWSSAKCPSDFSDDDMKHMVRYFYGVNILNRYKWPIDI